MIHRHTFDHRLRFSQIARTDLQLQIEADAGQHKRQHDDRRHDLEDRHPARTHCGNLVVGGKTPEHEHDGDQRRPRNRKRHCDRQNIDHEHHCGSDVHAVRHIFKNFHETRTRHAERKDTHRHDKCIKKVFGNIKIQSFEHSSILQG